MQLIDLNQNAQYATLVLNAVQQLRTENFGEILKEQLKRVFPSTAYVLFASDELDAADKDSYTKLNEELDHRVMKEGSLTVPGNNSFLLVFYEAAKTLTEERVKSILALVSKMKRNYANVISLLCVDKTDGDKLEKDNILQAAERLEGEAGISMLLCDTPKLTSCVGSVRALVRYIHCLSRNNTLASGMNTDRQAFVPATHLTTETQKRIAYVTMSEFDVEGYAQITQRVNEINRQSNASNPFPQGVLNNNFNKIVEEEKRSFEAFANLTAEEVPVPAGTLSRRILFGGNNDAANSKRNQLQKTLEYTFEHGIWEVYLAGLQERAEELCKKLIEGISVGDLPMVKVNCKKITVTGGAANWSCQLSTAYNMTNLLEQIRTQLGGAKDAYLNALPGEIYGVIQEKLGEVLTEESITEKQEALVAEKNKLQAGMYAGVTNVNTYWANINNIMSLLSTLHLTFWDSDKTYVLIPDDISKNWALYAGVALIGGTAVTPYNCQVLDNQEFQVLKVMYFTRAQLK